MQDGLKEKLLRGGDFEGQLGGEFVGIVEMGVVGENAKRALR